MNSQPVSVKSICEIVNITYTLPHQNKPKSRLHKTAAPVLWLAANIQHIQSWGSDDFLIHIECYGIIIS